MSRRHILGCCAAALILSPTLTSAKDYNTANEVMPGCRSFVRNEGRGGGPPDTYCAGLVEGLFYASRNICAPPGVTNAQAIGVIIAFIDARPARMRESFKMLAEEAMAAAWPCKQ